MEVAMTSRENQVPHYRMVEMVLDGIADWVRKYRHAVDARSEFADCHQDEVKATVNDLGMSRTAPAVFELRVQARVLRSPTDMR